jgi:hypothetical protein
VGSQPAPRVRRKKRDEELEQELVPPQAAVPRAPAIPALELQKTAGNRAVGAALDRWPMPSAAKAPAPEWPKEPQVIVGSDVMELVAWSWAESHQPGSVGEGKADAKEISLTTRSGEFSADIFQHAQSGAPFKEVVVVVPGRPGRGMTITLTEAVVVSLSGGTYGDAETWNLQFKERKLGNSPPAS